MAESLDQIAFKALVYDSVYEQIKDFSGRVYPRRSSDEIMRAIMSNSVERIKSKAEMTILSESPDYGEIHAWGFDLSEHRGKREYVRTSEGLLKLRKKIGGLMKCGQVRSSYERDPSRNFAHILIHLPPIPAQERAWRVGRQIPNTPRFSAEGYLESLPEY